MGMMDVVGLDFETREDVINEVCAWAHERLAQYGPGYGTPFAARAEDHVRDVLSDLPEFDSTDADSVEVFGEALGEYGDHNGMREFVDLPVPGTLRMAAILTDCDLWVFALEAASEFGDSLELSSAVDTLYYAAGMEIVQRFVGYASSACEGLAARAEASADMIREEADSVA